MKRNELISYALDFVAYLIDQTDDVEQVILYGSVARGDFDQESDVDIFIDTKNEKTEKNITKLTTQFSATEKAKKWKLKGITNHFSCLIGELDGPEWKELKRSMINNGIILYGKYKAAADKVNQYTLFSFSNIKPESKRISLHRKLFGFKMKGKKYSGLSEKYNLINLGKGNIIVPIEHHSKIKTLLRELRVPFKVYEIWSDYKLQ